MAKYLVDISQRCYQNTVVEVEAKDEAAAIDLAYERVCNDPDQCVWEAHYYDKPEVCEVRLVPIEATDNDD